MNVPLGSYPGGFHVLDFSERMTNDGAEATVIFEGSSVRRFELLRTIFPFWEYRIFEDEENDIVICCARLLSVGYPYPDINNLDMDESPGTPGDFIPFCFPQSNCLWPDTFSVQRSDNTCTAQPLECNLTDFLLNPLCFSTGVSPMLEMMDGKVLDFENDCSCQVTVNYRRKYNGTWPQIFRPCGETDFWKPPPIPVGTYINVRTEHAIQANTIPGDFLKYFPDNRFYTNDVTTVTENPCPLKPLANLPTHSTWQWCGANHDHAPPSPLTVDAKLGLGMLIQSTEMEVTWSGVPLPPFNTIRSMRGCVNEAVWLGFPSESVMFTGYRIDPISQFSFPAELSTTSVHECRDLYNITYLFHILTSPVNTANDYSPTEKPGAFIDQGVYMGQIGLHNRLWSENPIGIYSDDEGSASSSPTVCTNWVPIEATNAGCCAVGDAGQQRSLFRRVCFDFLFRMPICPTPPPTPEP